MFMESDNFQRHLKFSFTQKINIVQCIYHLQVLLSIMTSAHLQEVAKTPTPTQQ